MNKIQMIKVECSDWIEERERTLKKLMYHAQPEDKIKYQAQIDFISVVRINISSILKRVQGRALLEIKNAKPVNTVFLKSSTSIEDCVATIKAFEEKGYTTYYEAETKTIRTTAPKTRINELSKKYKCIQSYNLK